MNKSIIDGFLVLVTLWVVANFATPQSAAQEAPPESSESVDIPQDPEEEPNQDPEQDQEAEASTDETPSEAALEEEAPLVPPDPLPQDGPSYQIDGFHPLYVRDHADQPSIDDLMTTRVTLGVSTQGYIAPRADAPSVTLTLAEIDEHETEAYFASAVQMVIEAIRDRLVNQGLMGVYVAPDPRDLSDTGQDKRALDNPDLRLIMTTGIVSEIRTIASGDRIDDRERINHPLHERIVRNSPIAPYNPEIDPEGEGEAEAEGEVPSEAQIDRSLMNKRKLDRYIYFLSRHPGRRVDVSMAAGEEASSVALDYMITENKPLVLYFQISNTGTKQTDRVRERFGFFHTQFTNNDDILSMDYSTAGFDNDANSFSASYEAPFARDDRVRWRMFGNWSEFSADQVGFANADFTGEEYDLGGQIIANIYQDRELFIDFVMGYRYLNVQVDNEAFDIKGEEDFHLLSLGLELEQSTQLFSTQANAIVEFNVKNLNGDELEELGRTAPDDDWIVLHTGLHHLFYLEPVMDRLGWEDPMTPETSTLAHEVSIELRGQYAFGDRLIPQAETVAGGLYTVRGYPESAVAGDDVFIGRFEYRYHWPRSFALEAEPRELFGTAFRASPQFVYGRPDWDLVFKAFTDVAWVHVNDRFSFEDNERLWGVGVGMELVLKNNINVRLDWGFAMESVEAARVNRHSNRLHVVATFLF